MTQYIHYQGILICKGILAGQLKLVFLVVKDLSYAAQKNVKCR